MLQRSGIVLEMLPPSPLLRLLLVFLECPDGLLCTSAIPSHYKRYSHFLLAASRAGDPLVEFSSSNLENNLFGPGTSLSINSSSTTEDGALKDLNRNMGRPPNCCVLLEQSSSNTNSVDVVTIKTSMEKIQGIHQHRIQFTGGTKEVVSLGPFSQETKGSHDQESQYNSLQLNTLGSEADFSDCDISYSPLNTDEEKSTDGEEEVEEETKVKQIRKRLFAVKSPEDRSGKAKSGVVNKPAGTSQQRELEHNSVEVVISDCCETSNILPITGGISRSPSQASISRGILSSTNVLDLVKHTTKEFVPRIDNKRSGEEAEGLKLHSSILSAGECEWSKSNSKVKAVPAVKNKLLPLKLTEESVRPFQHWQAGSLEKSCSTAKTILDTHGNTLSHNNSYSVTEKEGRLSNTVVVPVSLSTISQPLPPVSAAKLKVQATPAKELKQMDIGVFFGLQPKTKMESAQKKNLSEKTQTLSLPTAAEKRSKSRKRKAEGSLGDSDVVTESPRKTATPAEPAFGGQRPWRKRYREPWRGDGETRKKQCPFYKKIPGSMFCFLNYSLFCCSVSTAVLLPLPQFH